MSERNKIINKIKSLVSVAIVLLCICLIVLLFVPSFKADGAAVSVFVLAIIVRRFIPLILIPVAMIVIWIKFSGTEKYNNWIFISFLGCDIAEYCLLSYLSSYIDKRWNFSGVLEGGKWLFTILIILGVVVIIDFMITRLPSLMKKYSKESESEG